MPLEEKITKFAVSVGVPSDARESFTLAVKLLVAATKSGTDAARTNKLPLPKRAPELFVKRRNSSETIVDFLRRVWKPWMDAGSLTRNDLRKLDQSAARGIDNWLAKNSLPDDIRVPTKKELNDSIIAQGGIGAILSSPGLAQVYASRLRSSARAAKSGSRPS